MENIRLDWENTKDGFYNLKVVLKFYQNNNLMTTLKTNFYKKSKKIVTYSRCDTEYIYLIDEFKASFENFVECIKTRKECKFKFDDEHDIYLNTTNTLLNVNSMDLNVNIKINESLVYNFINFKNELFKQLFAEREHGIVLLDNKTILGIDDYNHHTTIKTEFDFKEIHYDPGQTIIINKRLLYEKYNEYIQSLFRYFDEYFKNVEYIVIGLTTNMKRNLFNLNLLKKFGDYSKVIKFTNVWEYSTKTSSETKFENITKDMFPIMTLSQVLEDYFIVGKIIDKFVLNETYFVYKVDTGSISGPITSVCKTVKNVGECVLVKLHPPTKREGVLTSGYLVGFTKLPENSIVGEKRFTTKN